MRKTPFLAFSAVGVAAVLSLGACGSPQRGEMPNPAATPTSTTPEQTSTPTPTPTPEPTQLMPGTDHSRAAAEYAYPAKDVHDWLVQGPQAPNYPTDKKLVFLTFDDGPNTVVTPKDLDALKANHAPATFFYVTKGLPDAQGIPARTIAEGHAIGVHSASHNYQYLYPRRTANKTNIVEDYDKALAQLREVLGPDYTPGAFRYPGGHLSWKGMEPADDALAAKGAYWIDWNSMTGDAEPPKTHPSTANGMVQLVQRDTQDAKNNVIVVLMHDAEDKSMTTKALPGVIKYFRDNGYTFGIIG